METIQVAVTAAYAVTALWFLRCATYYITLRWSLLGIGVHMAVVTLRTGLQVAYPASLAWDWLEVHRITITLAAMGVFGDIQWRRG